MSRRRTYEEQAQDLERQIEALRERRRQALARHGEEERKALEHARYTIGQLVIDCVPQGEWKAIDLDRLEGILERNAPALASCVTDALPVVEASRRMREWERARRLRMAAQGDARGGDGDAE